MSRFRPRMSPSGAAVVSPAPTPVLQTTHSAPLVSPEEPSAPVPAPVPEEANALQRVAFVVLCTYMISGALNEWMLRLIGIKGYVSIVALLLLPFVWLASGAALRGLRHAIGRWWALFLLLMIADVPFSIWRGGSVILLADYVPRSYLQLFFIASLCVTVTSCRRLMYMNAIVSFLALLTCVMFGSYSEDGRYMVQGGAGFFTNSNELAMELLMGITQFAYVFSRKNMAGKIIAACGIAGSIPYILSTGSRGCTLAALAYGGLLLYTSRRRILAVAAIGVLAIVGLVFASSGALRRVSLMFGDEPGTSSAVESRDSRIELLMRSLQETVTHPLFGVGPGQFPVSVSEEAKQTGEWVQWLGTHNAYTQVSSECGIPAFLCYFAVNILCFTVNLRNWRIFRKRPDGEEVTLLSLALLSGILVYSICSFFFHMAYTGTLPLLGGQTIALDFVARRQLQATAEVAPAV